MSKVELNEIEKTVATLKMDPVRFEVMRSAFEAADDEMGAALRKASYSTNIKPRADATLLHCLDLDQERLTYRHQGRDFRLTDVAGRVGHKLLV